MGDHDIDGSAYFDQPGRRRRIGARRDVRPQPTALLDMLATLQSTLSQANRAGDTEGAREAISGRVACWIALADLADEVHPAYALACRRLAWIESQPLPAAPPVRTRYLRPTAVPAQRAAASPAPSSAASPAPSLAAGEGSPGTAAESDGAAGRPAGWHPVPRPRRPVRVIAHEVARVLAG